MFYTISTIAPICKRLHNKGKIIVLATGFFDLFHVEHHNFLQKAKATGDILIVAVESDARASFIKGEGRPIEPQNLRCTHVAQCHSAITSKLTVDYVIALPTSFDNFHAYDSLISAIRPEIYAVSSHTNHLKNKTFLAEKYGGQLVVVHKFNPAVSTTSIIQSKQL
jgi:cytidyltransferase-like protein